MRNEQHEANGSENFEKKTIETVHIRKETNETFTTRNAKTGEHTMVDENNRKQ